MPSFRLIRSLLCTASAVCAVAAMIVANQSGYRLVTESKETTARCGDAACAEKGLRAAALSSRSVGKPALFGSRVESDAVAVPVQQILPALGETVSDWSAYQPRKMTIAPHADLALDFEMSDVRQENGRTIWRGRNALTGAFLVTVATQNDWHAVLEVPASSSFEFHVTGQSASVTEKYETGVCGSGLHLADADLAQHTVVLSPDPNSNPEGPGGGSTGNNSADSIDVLFFYDGATLAANGGNRDALETTAAARLESANLALENSRVRCVRWRYVAAYRVPEYTVTEKLENDLGVFTFTDNPVGKFVDEKCALHGVDQAVLWVSGPRDFAGIAWVPAGDDSLAHFAAVVWDANYTVLAHELAHNFGCHHDRATEKAVSDDAKLSYGFRFQLEGADVGTIMSYAPNRVPYFSNPEVSYRNIKLGVSEGQSGAADNARVLASKGHLMKAHRAAEQAPIITYQPESAKVSRGTDFNLKVSASGEGLAFQWRKNGSAITGATSANFARTGSSADDAGNYDVVVTNGSGSVTSSAAQVVVSAAAEVSATGSQSQAAPGGGGGGAPSDWFFAALAAIGLVRFLRRKA